MFDATTSIPFLLTACTQQSVSYQRPFPLSFIWIPPKAYLIEILHETNNDQDFVVLVSSKLQVAVLGSFGEFSFGQASTKQVGIVVQVTVQIVAFPFHHFEKTAIGNLAKVLAVARGERAIRAVLRA